MKKLLFALTCLLAIALFSVTLAAQDAEIGVTVPVAITGELIGSNRTQTFYPDYGLFSAGFRVLATPQASLGPHLYLYSAVQANSFPYFYQDRYSDEGDAKVRVLQALLGYTRSSAKGSISLKAGKLSSAFGAFPLRYDDAANPLLDQPLSYDYVKVRPDQLPCKIGDLRQVTYAGVFTSEPGPDVDFQCGGADEEGYGIAPVTLYGLMGTEVEASGHRLDARLQLTNSSPANPRGVFASSQHPQLTAGGGYTIHQGFRVGMSSFRGPWLDKVVTPYLPAGSKLTDFSASGLGFDAQWARGSWSGSGEAQRFVFRYPRFVRDPASHFVYLELKRILSPRWYAAFRANYQANNRPQDLVRRSPAPYRPNIQAYEFAAGFRPNRFQLLKVGYEVTRIAGGVRSRNNVFGVQFVTSIDALSKVLR